MKKLLMLIPILILCFCGGLVLSYYMTTQFQGPFNFVELIQNQYTLLPVIVGGGAYLVYALSHLTDPKKPAMTTGSKNKEGKDTEQFFDSRWITEKELKTKPTLHFCTWDNIRQMKDGALIRSELSKGKLLINMYNPIHTLIIGTTGSGKTKKYIEPMIQIMSTTKTKPSFVIGDPKGELYRLQAHKLQSEGYDVKVFDLRNPFGSNRWNPLDGAYVLYHKAFDLEKEVKTHVGVNPADLHLKIIAREYNNEWYEFDGIAYPNKEALDVDLNSKKAQYIDLAENSLREIAGILSPIQPNATDQTWDRGSQEFIYGTMLAMLEDSLNPELGMTRDRFNFYNLRKICNLKDNDPEKPYQTLQKYFLGRGPLSKVPGLVSTAVNNAPGTTKSYMGIVGGHLGVFNDGGMCFATSVNEMNFDTFAEKPTALFIIIPDEKVSRHGIVTMMISQLYSKLVDLAGNYPDLKLPRAVYFLLDEFANLPKIEKMDTIISVSRSRNIFFDLVIQSYSQLSSKYGEEISQTIKDCCPVKVFIGTDDMKTCEDFSKTCGDITLQTTSVSESNQKDHDGKDNKNNTTSVSTTSRPLIYPSELSYIGGSEETCDIVVKILNEFPIRTKTTMSWATPMFDHTVVEQEYAPSRSLNEAEATYDVSRRNSIILNKKPSQPNINNF